MRFLKTIFLFIVVILAINYLGGDLKNLLGGALNTLTSYFPSSVSTSTVVTLEEDTLKIQDVNTESSKPNETVQPVQKPRVPGPLINDNPPASKDSSNLSDVGVLKYTNDARLVNGLSSLSLNSKLSLAALAKADDMFSKGYFEHISPTGVGPSDVVKNSGYEYLSIGENLALGIFKGDGDLVDAWMASPGHRANILGKHFTEIGIAVKKGIYQGKEVWMAVQEFGTPASLCNKPDLTLMNQVSSISTFLDSLKTNLDNLKVQIESTNKNDPKYNSLVSSYNNLVNEYNTKASEAQNLSNAYNLGVKTYNTCLASYTN